MGLKNLVVITELSGVYKMVGNRSNGLIVEDLTTSKRKFVASRRHQFTPLESISIYTNDGDAKPLNDVFQTMSEMLEEHPLPTGKYNSTVGYAYLEKVLPEYDEDQVLFGDVKKLIKWFSFLNQHDLLDFSEEEEEVEAVESAEEPTE
ncbi:MAG: DUF5606 domain-containing protein [Saprospiraceae bacterium]